MKKFLPLLILVPYIFIAGTTDPKRFNSADDMCRTLMQVFQSNDSLRFVAICASRDEATAAFVTPFSSDNNKFTQQQQAIDKYFANDNRIARDKFRHSRNSVTNAHLDWKDAQYVSSVVTVLKTPPPGINYLYDIRSKWRIGDREIDVDLKDAMETTAGWNAGMNMIVQVGLNAQQTASRDQMMADSVRMADSIMMVEMYMIAKMKADSTAMADSIAAVHNHKHHH